MPERLFNPHAFGLRVQRAMAARDLSLRKLAAVLGVHYSALQRVTTGREPSVETFLRLDRWLKRYGR